MRLVLGGLFSFFAEPRSLQYKAGAALCLALLLDYRYVLYMTPLQKT